MDGLTVGMKLDRSRLGMDFHPIARIDGVHERPHGHHGRSHLMCTLVPQALQHLEVMLGIPRLLHDGAAVADYDGVGGDDDAQVAIVDLALVDVNGLLLGGFQDVFVRGQRLGQVLGEVGGDDLDVGQAKLHIYRRLVSTASRRPRTAWYLPGRATVSAAAMPRPESPVCPAAR